MTVNRFHSILEYALEWTRLHLTLENHTITQELRVVRSSKERKI